MYELTVDGMSCGHCVGRVTKSVQGVDPAAKVDVDLASKKVKVDSKADVDEIADAIDEAGYPVLERKSARKAPAKQAPPSSRRTPGSMLTVRSSRRSMDPGFRRDDGVYALVGLVA